MTTLTISLALLAGWCGTPYPRRWKFPFPPLPKPDPEICPVCGKILGALGGLSLSVGLSYLAGIGMDIETTLITGFIGGMFANDIASTIMDNVKR